MTFTTDFKGLKYKPQILCYFLPDVNKITSLLLKKIRKILYKFYIFRDS
jgi:hypothetical protein